MDIDMAVLRALEHEQEISFDVLVDAIEQALLVAYQRTPGAHEDARVELDRKSGHVTVGCASATTRARSCASGTTRPRASAGSPRRRQSRSSCSGCATPRTTCDSASSPARRATSSRASCSRAATRRWCTSTSARSRPSCRRRSGCRGSSTTTDSGCAASSSPYARARRARRSRCPARTRTWCKKLFALEVPEIADGTVEIAAIAREAGHRTKIAVRSHVDGVNAKGACIGPMGQRVRNVMTELHGEKIDIVDWSEDPAEMIAHALSPAQVIVGRDRRRGGPVGAGRRPRLPALARDRQGGPERAARRPADRLAHRHPVRPGQPEAGRRRLTAEVSAEPSCRNWRRRGRARRARLVNR